MRIFTASLATETNTFSPIPTGALAFEVARDTAEIRPNLFSSPVAAWREASARDGHDTIDGLVAGAAPGGRVLQSVYEGLRDEILQQLNASSLPVDVVLLSLHGAMIAEGYDDCEGDLMRRVRELVGDRAIIGCLLDPHCVLTTLMLRSANLIVLFKEWPHSDYLARARDLYRLAVSAAQGEIRPAMAVTDCRMLGNFPTVQEPMSGFVRKMIDVEATGRALSVSFVHSFIWADVAEMGAKLLVITDDDLERGVGIGEQLRGDLWRIRDTIGPRFLSIDEALDRCEVPRHAPVVLADGADGAAGGAPGDSTFVLRRLLERGFTDVVTGCYWDPIAVRMCREAGEGARISLRVGGKLGATSGQPVDIVCKIERIIEDAFQGSPQGFRIDCGPSVWVSAQGIHIVIISERAATFHQNAFTQFGIELPTKRIVVVKGAMHFYPSFAPIASDVLFLSGPGTLPMDPRSIDYRVFDKPYWPRVTNPFSLE